MRGSGGAHDSAITLPFAERFHSGIGTATTERTQSAKMDPKQHAAYIKRFQNELLPRFDVYAKTLAAVLQEAAKRYAPLGIVQARHSKPGTEHQHAGTGGLPTPQGAQTPLFLAIAFCGNCSER